MNVKMISKRAERLYPNGYCVYVLYCNRCQKRRPTYACSKQYKKRSTNCPFSLKFTRQEGQNYVLSGGTYYHNHRLDSAVLEKRVLDELDQMVGLKPAVIKRWVQEKYSKQISYAQIAYEMAKRKKVNSTEVR